jgi:predicted Zn-dependent protease
MAEVVEAVAVVAVVEAVVEAVAVVAEAEQVVDFLLCHPTRTRQRLQEKSVSHQRL